MRLKLAVAVLLLASLTIFSCSKDNDTTDPDENGSAELMTKMIQGLVPRQNTVFVFNYDANKRIKSVINVSKGDTFEASFNATGLVMTIISKGPGLHLQRQKAADKAGSSCSRRPYSYQAI